ncbi:MAG: hypothetical protein WCB74_12070, partial [Pseudolabrys sp.]
TSNARKTGADAIHAHKERVSGCAALGQLGDAVSQDRFLSFALSQAPGQLQRHGHFIVVFAQEATPASLTLRQTMRARKERSLRAKNAIMPPRKVRARSAAIQT